MIIERTTADNCRTTISPCQIEGVSARSLARLFKSTCTWWPHMSRWQRSLKHRRGLNHNARSSHNSTSLACATESWTAPMVANSSLQNGNVHRDASVILPLDLLQLVLDTLPLGQCALSLGQLAHVPAVHEDIGPTKLWCDEAEGLALGELHDDASQALPCLGQEQAADAQHGWRA
eukprot:CAMPEP_0204159464 /NCGR_PEP_ID=MMETSP0361-20130328/33032_1 /ASSEMBLY_ACC=CAM_ASM_000343 /TAXON_ID=268821 /ORGANISM="Scrippsiella Hangoei, Strain SHTV-5" /LENGTH=175 /DNA_ID=CAMNT_0051115591 /DNA_START=38 /DNA_END=562 /DNA_ORIENTATION=+